MKEVHHRVKNNLQLISSILSLEESETKEEQTKKILKTTKDRIQSISLIHTKLYQDTKIREVELKVYMEDLMNQLLSLSSNVELDLNIDPVKLELDQMIPLGLILNELVTNSLKYAFPIQQEARIELKIKEEEENLQVLYKDNGGGVDLDQMKKSNSIGMIIVEDLIYQLKGEFEMKPNPKEGFSFNLKMKKV